MNVEVLQGSTLNNTLTPYLPPPKPEKRKHNFEESAAKEPRMMESSDTEAEEEDDRPECEYGTDCYRKNQQHFKQFKHSKKRKRKAIAEEGAKAKAEEEAKAKAEEEAKTKAEEEAQAKVVFSLIRRRRSGGWFHPRMR